MINLRYHIVSITAVFLALGIGIFMGSSFLGRAAYDQVQKNVDSAEERISATREENRELNAELDELEARGAEMGDEGARRLFADDLDGTPVLVIAVEGAAGDPTERLVATLEASSARYGGVVTVQPKVLLDDDDSVAQLSEVLGVASDDPVVLRRRLTTALAAAMAAAAAPDEGEAPEPGAVVPPDPSADLAALLVGLEEAGFVAYAGPASGVGLEEVVTGGGHRFVLVGGAETALPDEAFLSPLVVELTAEGPAPVVVATAAEGDTADEIRTVVLGPLREDEQVRDRISTVDHLETFEGLAAVVEALEDLDEARYGHYGLGDGATSLVPAPAEG